MREVICINVGQAGIQMANAAWELFCMEHGIEANGKLKNATDQNNNGFHTFFQEVPSGNYVPRAIGIDLEPTVIDEIRTASYRLLWHPDYLINCYDDAANNFARGHFTVGKMVIDRFMDQLRKCVHACDRIQGFIILNSYGGGTGSGLSALICEHIDIEYSKSPTFQQTIYPAPRLATAIVEPYNALLSASKSIDHTDVVMLIDNEAAYDICTKQLSIPRPVYSNLNRLIAQIFSSMTVSIRFGSSLDNDLVQLQTNLVPYPRIHFPTVNYAPIVDPNRACHEQMSITEITRELFEDANQLIKCDVRLGKYMSCCIQYRGLITPRQVNLGVYEVKRRTDINFVDWCPTGFKLGISPMPPIMVPGSEIAPCERNCAMFCNTTAISQVWQGLGKKFDVLFNKRAFVHWYVGEGMEEGEFVEAMDDMHKLIDDYAEVGAPSDGDGMPEVRSNSQRSVSRGSRDNMGRSSPENVSVSQKTKTRESQSRESQSRESRFKGSQNGEKSRGSQKASQYRESNIRGSQNVSPTRESNIRGSQNVSPTRESMARESLAKGNRNVSMTRESLSKGSQNGHQTRESQNAPQSRESIVRGSQSAAPSRESFAKGRDSQARPSQNASQYRESSARASQNAAQLRDSHSRESKSIDEGEHVDNTLNDELEAGINNYNYQYQRNKYYY